MSRLARIVLVAAATLCVAAPAASAVPKNTLDDNLAAMWTTLLETPFAESPFGGGGPASACTDLGGTVAPFGPGGAESCTVKPGTKIFVAAASWECSTFAGDHFDFGTTEPELRECARATDVQETPIVTVDGVSVPVSGVETQLVSIVLPADNLFGQPEGAQGQFVAHGWVTLLHPLTPGAHTIVMEFDDPADTITTTIIVQPGALA